MCNQQVEKFIDVCGQIGMPVNTKKTFWGTTCLVFLGLLIDTIMQIICIPTEKIDKAKKLIQDILGQKKVTVHQLQKLCGFLNFLCRAVVPGRAFMRCLYGHIAGNHLKPHHHLRISGEMRADLNMWLIFLNHPTAYCRPFMDIHGVNAVDIDFFTDSFKNFSLGFGRICGDSWFYHCWDSFTAEVQPSIEYLELYAVVTGVLLWIERFRNKRVYLFCDNQSVVHMINGMTSSCKNCMILIRILTLQGLFNNVRIFCKHVRSEDNGPADALSRLDLARFRKLTAHKNMSPVPENLLEMIWPIEKIWLKI